MAAVSRACRPFPNFQCYSVVLATPPVRYASSEVDTVQKKFPKVSDSIAGLRRGTGGRSSFSGQVATVFGATGFLGRRVVNQLGKTGTQLILPYRCDAHRLTKLKLCGDLGQILFTEFYLKDEESLYKAMKHSNLVINCIGRDFETKNFPFEEVHVKGARNIARIARESGVKTLIHLSALNVCENPKPIILRKGSKFYSSKWEGEQAVREEFPDAVIIRPADMWGAQDTFIFYYMREMRRTWRALSMWNRGHGIIKQPVYVSDVAKGIAKAAADPYAAGHIFQAVGPHRYELAELMDWFHRVMNRTPESFYYRLELRYDISFWLKLMFCEIFLSRGRKVSWERLEREHTTDVFLRDLPTLEDLGVELTPFETRIFHELAIFRAHAYKDVMMKEYVRPVEPAPFAKS